MADTRFTKLLADPRVAEARALLQAALADHQAALPTAPQPADPALAEGYAAMLDRFAAARGRGLFFPYLGSGLGRGPWVELADGSVKLDFIGGIGAHPYGHGDAGIFDARLDAALGDTVMQGNLQQNPESLLLSERLIAEANRFAPGRFGHCFLSTTGAMANENGAKILFQAKAPASRILAFSHCFAGRTLGMSWVTDKAAYRQGVPKAADVDYVPFFDPDKPEASTRHAVSVLRRHLDRYPGQHAMFIAELVQGEGGYYTGTTEFFRALFELCQERNVGVLIDEVQTFGRTTEMFAFQHFGISDLVDVVSIGKLSQVCATIYRDGVNPGAGLLSQTFTGSSAAILAGDQIVRRLREGDHFGEEGRNAGIHARFVQHLERLAAAHPDWVGGPFGVGAMIGFTPFGGDGKKAGTLLKRLYDNGLLGFNAGANPTRLRFLPPLLVVTDAEIDAAAEILERTLAEVAAS
ncbi:MAG: Acetylornithine aminotransferase [Pseudomonadota bacterium]|jgi:acetylornithine aminotransferase